VNFDGNLLFGLAAALGGGLLIGIERERRKGFGQHRALAGVRTFTLASLTGATAGLLGAPLLEFAGGALVVVLAAIARWRERSRDPGITTELALFATYLIGLVAVWRPVLAGGGAVLIAGLLASRSALHRFSVELLTETELRDGLLFAALALIVLPLLPDASIAWLGASPRRIFALVVTFMGLQAAGYVALRVAGPRLGLALSGLASGFVSSTGTIAALGTRARGDPRLLGACISGALFSCLATVVLLAIVVGAVYPPAFSLVGPSLGLALFAAVTAATLALWRQRGSSDSHPISGRPFNLLHALGFAAILVGVTAGMELVNARYGYIGAGVAAAVTGIFDVHASATSTLSLAASGVLPPSGLLVPILLAFSTNTCSKLVAAFTTGGVRYGIPVASGLLAIAIAVWAPLLWMQ
jgi:uncharacterized membrane protein (DUF4010 family)